MKSYNLLCARSFVCWTRTLEGSRPWSQCWGVDRLNLNTAPQVGTRLLYQAVCTKKRLLLNLQYIVDPTVEVQLQRLTSFTSVAIRRRLLAPNWTVVLLGVSLPLLIHMLSSDKTLPDHRPFHVDIIGWLCSVPSNLFLLLHWETVTAPIRSIQKSARSYSWWCCIVLLSCLDVVPCWGSPVGWNTKHSLVAIQICQTRWERLYSHLLWWSWRMPLLTFQSLWKANDSQLQVVVGAGGNLSGSYWSACRYSGCSNAPLLYTKLAWKLVEVVGSLHVVHQGDTCTLLLQLQHCTWWSSCKIGKPCWTSQNFDVACFRITWQGAELLCCQHKPQENCWHSQCCILFDPPKILLEALLAFLNLDPKIFHVEIMCWSILIDELLCLFRVLMHLNFVERHCHVDFLLKSKVELVELVVEARKRLQ